MDWSSWVVSEAQELPTSARRQDRVTDWYRFITCPHCNDKLKITAAGLRKNKGAVCRQHLANARCDRPIEERSQQVDASRVSVVPSKRDRTNDAVHRNCRARIGQLEADVERMHRRMDKIERNFEAVSEAVGASPPHSSDDEGRVPHARREDCGPSSALAEEASLCVSGVRSAGTRHGRVRGGRGQGQDSGVCAPCASGG